MYAVEVVNSEDVPWDVAKIERLIWEVVRDMDRREREGKSAVPVGILTTLGRDEWAEVFFTRYIRNIWVLMRLSCRLVHTSSPSPQQTPLTSPQSNRLS